MKKLKTLTTIPLLISANCMADEIDKWDMKTEAKVDVIHSTNVDKNFTYSTKNVTFNGEAESLFSLRDSKITFIRPSEDNSTLGLVEIDFQGKKLSKSHAPQIKHAFYRHENITTGYTWSNFSDFITQPKTLSYQGHQEGVSYAHRLQIKLTQGNWAFALEQNNTTSRKEDSPNSFDYMNPTSDKIQLKFSEDKQRYPDITVKYRSHSRFHYASISAVVRNHSLIKDNLWGYGINMTGRANTVIGEFRGGIIAGQGIGSMMGEKSYLDAIETTDASALTTSIHTYASYSKKIDEKINMNATISYAHVKNPEEHKDVLETASALSASLNATYQYDKQTSFGIEIKHNEHKINDSALSMGEITFTEQQFIASTTYKF